MTTTPLVAKVNKVATRSTRRNLVVRAEKISHGKGGEEGGKAFNNDAFGMVAKNANYGLFASAISKVRDVPASLYTLPYHHPRRRVQAFVAACAFLASPRPSILLCFLPGFIFIFYSRTPLDSRTPLE